MEKEKVNPKWNELLEAAVNEPGMLLKAYTNFYNYSAGNQMLALFECIARGIEPGPIATYNRWQALDRRVKRGEKAITLCLPITVKDKDDENKVKTIFVYKPRWFVLSQTEGKELGPEAFAIPEWNKELAMIALEIEETKFSNTDGNIQGYAFERTVAINPLAALPIKTLFHEIAHILLGHTDRFSGKEPGHTEKLPRNIKEVEAEAVALIVLESLGLPGAEYCRGYIQEWYKSKEAIPESNAMRIFRVADRILKAGINKKMEEVAA